MRVIGQIGQIGQERQLLNLALVRKAGQRLTGGVSWAVKSHSGAVNREAPSANQATRSAR